ncbi:MAG: hypothetical protein AAGA06_11200 [Pseudomonadota bacterium]
MLTRDKLIREARMRGGNLPAFLVIYGLIVGTMVGTALAMT